MQTRELARLVSLVSNLVTVEFQPKYRIHFRPNHALDTGAGAMVAQEKDNVIVLMGYHVTSALFSRFSDNHSTNLDNQIRRTYSVMEGCCLLRHERLN